MVAWVGGFRPLFCIAQTNESTSQSSTMCWLRNCRPVGYCRQKVVLIMFKDEGGYFSFEHLGLTIDKTREEGSQYYSEIMEAGMSMTRKNIDFTAFSSCEAPPPPPSSFSEICSSFFYLVRVCMMVDFFHGESIFFPPLIWGCLYYIWFDFISSLHTHMKFN